MQRTARTVKRLFSSNQSLASKQWNPEAVGLPKGFLLTNYTKMKGWGCKIDKESLQTVLKNLDTQVMVDSPDCAYDQIAKGLTLVSTLDFFYPLVDDPYNQGMIGAANVLSDLYSCGILEIRQVLMIISASTQMKKEEQLIVTGLMMKGFASKVREAGSLVVGGQSVMNEFPMIGGAAIGLARGEDPYIPRNAKPGDILVLTKPLGSQILVNVNQYWKNNDAKWKTLSQEKKLITEDQIEKIYSQGLEYLPKLNKVAAEVMLKHGATSSTDVTGFGILGHAQNLAEIQLAKVNYIIERLPSYSVLPSLDRIVRDFKYKEGYAAETSGGLMISLPADRADEFIKEMGTRGEKSWKIGKVVSGSGKALMASNLSVDSVV